MNMYFMPPNKPLRAKQSSFAWLIIACIIVPFGLLLYIANDEIWLLFGTISIFGSPLYFITLIVIAAKGKPILPTLICLILCFISFVAFFSSVPSPQNISHDILVQNNVDNIITQSPSTNILEINPLENTTQSVSQKETTAEQTTAEISFRDKCQSYSYEDISRYPNEYIGKNAYFKGKVIQVIESFAFTGTNVVLRIATSTNEYGLDQDIIYVDYLRKDSNEPRILENDELIIYGILGGLHTYSTILGQEISIPQITMYEYDLII